MWRKQQQRSSKCTIDSGCHLYQVIPSETAPDLARPRGESTIDFRVDFRVDLGRLLQEFLEFSGFGQIFQFR